jgi:CMP-N,N'-diacetyllegionaminic acid synthase
VIPARRGSQRLFEKNIRVLRGKPMLAYTIEAALSSTVFERVYVSTEDDEIAGLAEANGAAAHLRPTELAGDLVSATEVCIDLYVARREMGEVYDALVCLQPSSPLRSADDVRRAWMLFQASKADFLVSVTPIDPHYFHWAVQGSPGRSDWKLYFGHDYMIERPLLPPVSRPNGAIKIARVAPVLNERNFFGENLAVYEMPEERSLHVAELFDFRLAEYLLHSNQ